MLKRIIVLIGVLVVCLTCAIPAFAIGGGSSEDTVYSGIQFETLTLLDGAWEDTVVDWPFNESPGYPGFVQQEDEIENAVFSAFVTGSSNSVSGSFTCYDALSVKLESSYSFYDGDFDLRLFSADGGSLTFDRVKISYNVVWIQPNDLGTHYETRYEYITYDSSKDGYVFGSVLDIGSMIERAYSVNLGKSLISDGMVLLADLDVEIKYSVGGYGESVNVWASASPMYRDDIGRWVNRHALTTAAERKFDPLGWLLGVVSGFLSFELFPGFSLDTLFTLSIIVGLVFWLIRLLT